MTIGEKLTALRIRKGYSQVEFCEDFNRRYPQLAIKRPAYSKWETDEHSMEIRHLRALAMYHKVTTDELVFDHIVLSIFNTKKLKSRGYKIARSRS